MSVNGYDLKEAADRLGEKIRLGLKEAGDKIAKGQVDAAKIRQGRL